MIMALFLIIVAFLGIVFAKTFITLFFFLLVALGGIYLLARVFRKSEDENGLIIKKFVLPDVIIDKYSINCSIKIGEELAFFAEGYGDPFSEDGRGCPIVIENRSGVLTLYVYSDINNEDYTHNITLEKARESNRK